MSTLNNKIECLKRLIKLDHHHELMYWMVESRLAAADIMSSKNKSDQHIAEVIYLNLQQAKIDEKIILLDYEWTILPREHIKIMVVTEKESQTFIYEA